MSGQPSITQTFDDATFISTYRILPSTTTTGAGWDPQVTYIYNSPSVNPSEYVNKIDPLGTYVNSTAIMTYNNMTQTGISVSIENAYTVFYGPINDSSNAISTEISGSGCFIDPCTSSSGNVLTCPLADGIREFIAEITVTPVVSFFSCENGLTITISPISSSGSSSCPIREQDVSLYYSPISFSLGLNETKSVGATLVSLLTLYNDVESLTYQTVSAMYAPILFELLDVNGQPTTYNNACSLKVYPQDSCFTVYFGITRCCQGFNFILISQSIALQFFFWMSTSSIYILTIAKSGSGSLPM